MLRRTNHSLLSVQVLSLALVLPSLQAQTAVTDDNGHLVFKANAQTVVIDVVVLGHDGKPVHGLHKEDFRALEDGHEQKITFFEEHGAAQPLEVVNRPKLPPNVFTNIPLVKPNDAVTVLLLDNLNTPLQDQSNVRSKMMKYLEGIQPGRRFAIFTLGNQLRYVQGFTDDPALLAAALRNQKRGAGTQSSVLLQSSAEMASGNGGAALQQQALAEHPSAATADALASLQRFQTENLASQNDLRTLMTLQAFQELAHYLAGVPGRKNVAWFSGSFPSLFVPNGQLDALREYSEEIKKTDAQLSAAEVALYPIGAEGLAGDALYDVAQRAGAVVTGGQVATAYKENPSGATSQSQKEETVGLQNDYTARDANHTTMDEIAKDTGGEAFYNNNGLNDALERVADHGSHYYTLTYTPTNKAMDGQFRKTEVKVTGGKYKLAYRRGYFATDAKQLKAAASKPAGDPLHPYADPLHPYMGPGMPDSTQISIALRVQPESTPAAASNAAPAASRAGDNDKLATPLQRYAVDFITASRGLAFSPTPDGGRSDRIEATLVVYDQNGRAVNWMVRQLDLTMDAARYAKVREEGVNFRLEIDVPKDGFTLRGGIYDWNSNVAGTLEVPFSNVVAPVQSAAAKPQAP